MSSSKALTVNSTSSLTVSVAPQMGDEYVLVKKTSASADQKVDEKTPQITNYRAPLADTQLFGLAARQFARAGGRFGSCNCRLTYDFSITPSTSSTLQTVVALAPAQDTSFSNLWKNLFETMRMNSAEVQLDFTQFTSTVGHDVALSPVVIGYRGNACLSTQYYADVSDWKNSVFAGYSLAHPIVKFKIPKSWFAGWNTGQEAVSVGNVLNSDWAPTQYNAATLHQGFVHIASQKVMFDTERVIVGRLILNMTMKGQL